MNASINTFQMKIPEEMNRMIKVQAANTGKTKQDWIMSAIIKQLSESERVV